MKNGLEIWLDASDESSMDADSGAAIANGGTVHKWRCQIGDNFIREYDKDEFLMYKQLGGNPFLKRVPG